MNILVCVKQVPDTDKMTIDPVKNTLVRDGATSILNPYDSYAIEAAARIKDKSPDDTTINVLSLGPVSAESVLRESLAMAADEAYLLTDSKFAGSDTFATSLILSKGIRYIEDNIGKQYDLIFCGRQAIDGDTAQVGPEIAEHFGYAQVTCALEAQIEGEVLRIRQETESGYRIIESDMPCVVTFTKPQWEPRAGTLKRTLAARRAQINTITYYDLSSQLPEDQVGLSGSPTRVLRTFTPERSAECIMIDGKDPQTKGMTLADTLTKEGFLFNTTI